MEMSFVATQPVVGFDKDVGYGPVPVASPDIEAQDRALSRLLVLLQERRYSFVTPTPASHARVVARPEKRRTRSLRDVLGWSLPFESGTIDPAVEELLQASGMVESRGGSRRAKVRVSSLSEHLFLHSAYPTTQADAVFFGPDSYRFADMIQAELADRPGPTKARIVDVGTGSGVGAIIASHAFRVARIWMTDVNPLALRFARINAAAAEVRASAFECSNLNFVDGEFDIVTANPPYIIDPDSRLYRDGGTMHGGQVSLDMARMVLDRLAPGGRMLLYTGSAIVEGEDVLKGALRSQAHTRDFDLRYRELDPDVFGEELEKAAYRDVERIALVAAVITRPA